jgi:hypothetical protein
MYMCMYATNVDALMIMTYQFYISQIKAIEVEIGLGQIEEVMEMAKSELFLIDLYFGKE